MKHKIGIQLDLHFTSLISTWWRCSLTLDWWVTADKILWHWFTVATFFYLNFCWTGLTWLPDYAIMGIKDIALIRKADVRQCELLNSIASARFPLLPDSPISPRPLSPRSQRPIRKWFFHQILEKISPHMATRGWQNDKEWQLFKFSSSLSTFSSLPSLI